MAAISTRGMSVRQLAIEAGINRATLQGRINNARPFNTDELAMIAAALGMEPAEVVRLDLYGMRSL